MFTLSLGTLVAPSMVKKCFESLERWKHNDRQQSYLFSWKSLAESSVSRWQHEEFLLVCRASPRQATSSSADQSSVEWPVDQSRGVFVFCANYSSCSARVGKRCRCCAVVSQEKSLTTVGPSQPSEIEQCNMYWPQQRRWQQRWYHFLHHHPKIIVLSVCNRICKLCCCDTTTKS